MNKNLTDVTNEWMQLERKKHGQRKKTAISMAVLYIKEQGSTVQKIGDRLLVTKKGRHFGTAGS